MNQLRVAQSGPGTVRLSWQRIQVDGMATLTLVIYYSMLNGIQNNITVPSRLTTHTIMNLREGTTYEFSMAVEKQVGTEKSIGEQTQPLTIEITGGENNEGDSEGSGKYYSCC